MSRHDPEWWARIAGGAALIAALAITATGLRRQHALYDAGAAEFGIVQVATNISERAMVIDATFTGVERRPDGRLYSTYDRTAPQSGKKSCPT
jgi:hypothetical protein